MKKIIYWIVIILSIAVLFDTNYSKLNIETIIKIILAVLVILLSLIKAFRKEKPQKQD